MLLKVDCELLRRSLPIKQSRAEDFKLVNEENIKAMRITVNKKQGKRSCFVNKESHVNESRRDKFNMGTKTKSFS